MLEQAAGSQMPVPQKTGLPLRLRVLVASLLIAISALIIDRTVGAPSFVNGAMNAVFPRTPAVGVQFPEFLTGPLDLIPSGLESHSALVGGSCRVVVVSSTGCAGSRTLAIGWVSNVLTNAASAGEMVNLAWLVFGPSAEVLAPFELLQPTDLLPPIRSLQIGKAAVRRWFGTASTPLTIIVDPQGVIRFSQILDRSPTATEINLACTASSPSRYPQFGLTTH